MAQLVVFILDDVSQIGAVLDAWEEAGAPGITILNSTGLGRVRQAALRDDVPLMPSLDDFLRREEHHHRTLFTVINDEAALERLIEVTRAIIGEFEQQHNGFLFVVPVTRVLGIR